MAKHPEVRPYLEMVPQSREFRVAAVMFRAGIEPGAMDMHGKLGGKRRVALDPHANVGRARMCDDHDGSFMIEQACGSGAFMRQDEIGDIAEPMLVLCPVHMQRPAEKPDRCPLQMDDGSPRLKMKVIAFPPVRQLPLLHHLMKPGVIVMVAVDGIHGNGKTSAGKPARKIRREKSQIACLDHGTDAMLLMKTDESRRHFRMRPVDIT